MDDWSLWTILIWLVPLGLRNYWYINIQPQLHNQGHRGLLLKKCNFCISAFSEAKSNRRGGVRAGSHCTTQTLWEPGRHRCGGNKWNSSENPAAVPHTHTPLWFFILQLRKRSSTDLPCAMWGKLSSSSVTVRTETIHTHSCAWVREWKHACFPENMFNYLPPL